VYRTLTTCLCQGCDLEPARRRREAAISQNNARENKSRVAHNYKKGDWILVLSRHLDPKLQQHLGLFKVLSYEQSSGTLYIQRKNYVEPINIRNVRPYYGPKKARSHWH